MKIFISFLDGRTAFTIFNCVEYFSSPSLPHLCTPLSQWKLTPEDCIPQTPLPLGLQLSWTAQRDSRVFFLPPAWTQFVDGSLTLSKAQLLRGSPAATARALGVAVTFYSFLEPDHITVNGLFIRLLPLWGCVLFTGRGREGWGFTLFLTLSCKWHSYWDIILEINL